MTKNEDATQGKLNDTQWVVKQSAPFHTLRPLLGATNMVWMTNSCTRSKRIDNKPIRE